MTAYLTLPDGRRLAHRLTQGRQDASGPVLIFLPGYMSDMAGSKAAALFAHAEAQGHACLLLDYSGCGQSSGRFGDGALSRWRDEVLALIAHRCEGRDLVLVGSSMGGWLMVLVALAPRQGQGAGRPRPRARFHRLGVRRRPKSPADDRRDALRTQSLWAGADAHPPAVLARRRG